jgi:hypothetical protein
VKRKDTTNEQVEDVRARLARGETHSDIVKATGLSPTTVSRIKDGWRPRGRKPIFLFPSRARQRGER